MNRKQWREWYTETYLKSAHWSRVREHVKGRSDGQCERCGAEMVAVHHLHYRSLWHELDDTSCVMGVCAACHDYLHGRSSHDPAAVRPKCSRCWDPSDVTYDGRPMCLACAEDCEEMKKFDELIRNVAVILPNEPGRLEPECKSCGRLDELVLDIEGSVVCLGCLKTRVLTG
jgi:ribosomal protein S14